MIELLKELEEQKEQLQNAGAENIKHYTLVNNDGYSFFKNEVVFDLRHWGSIDFWTISSVNGFLEFNTFEQAVDYIQSL